MKHYLKNTSGSQLIVGDITLGIDELYEFYDDFYKIPGNLFKSFRKGFSYELIENNMLTYYYGNIISNLNSFKLVFNNIPSLDDYKDNQNFKIYYLLNDDKLYEPINPTTTPKSIDYKTDIKRLHQKLTFKKGMLVECEYFKNLTITQNELGLDVFNYSDNILRVLAEYHVSPNSYTDYRVVKRYWAYMDGTYSNDYKESVKYYDTINSRNEGTIRRENIINDCITSISGLIIMTEPTITTVKDAEIFALPVLNEIDGEVNKYVKGYIEPLITKISTIDVSIYGNLGNWFDNTIPNSQASIRQYLVSKLLEGELTPNEIIKV